MRLPLLCAFSALVLSVAVAGAQDVTGTILIKKRLTKRSVTASVSVYQRGATVALGKDAVQDPIAYEQSRVVVYLEGAGPVASPDSGEPVTMQIEQQDRRFVPDLLVVPVGSTVLFPNMDPIFHNIYSLSKPKSFDLGSYDRGQTRRVVFPKPGIVEIYCHLHPNMAATVLVTSNRWFARPDSAGHFRIPNVPPGQYTVVAWHKSSGVFRKKITVEAGHDATATFFIPLDIDPREGQPRQDSAQRAGTE
jgi:plastocyanin